MADTLEVKIKDDSGKEFTVVLRTKLNHRDSKAVKSFIIGQGHIAIEGEGDDAKPIPMPDMMGAQEEKMVRSIVSWDILGSDGKVLPVEPLSALRDSLDNLVEDLVNQIMVAVPTDKPRSKTEETKFRKRA